MRRQLTRVLSAFYRWQRMRAPWLVMGGTSLTLNLAAHYIFQNALGLPPCEYCVYIRFAMFCTFFGCIITAIRPENTPLRVLFGWGLNGYGIIQGAVWNFKLEKIYIILEKLQAGGDFFALGAGASRCSLFPRYPLGLPLDKWFPGWFSPTGGCGPIDWSFFGLNMPECLFIFYGIYIAALVLIIAGEAYGRAAAMK